MSKKMLVSFSGGRTSAFMARLISISPLYADYEKVYIFANTGREREETLLFVKNCAQYFELPVVWVEAIVSQKKGVGSKYKVVDYYSAARREWDNDQEKPDTPFTELCKKYGIPNKAKEGHCTRDLKLTPISKYMKDHHGKDYIEAIGIRADEAHREANKFYPLIELGIDEKVVREFWARQPFDLGLKDYQGNCDFCFKKSLRKRLTLIKEEPEQFQKWIDDEKHRNKNRHTYDRDGFSSETLIKMSEEYFKPAEDKFESGAFFYQMLPFAEVNNFAGITLDQLDLDKEKPCMCSGEA